MKVPGDPSMFALVKWAAVYGASVARQVHDIMRDNLGPLSDAEWERVVEKATEIAIACEKAGDRLLEGEDKEERGPCSCGHLHSRHRWFNSEFIDCLDCGINKCPNYKEIQNDSK